MKIHNVIKWAAALVASATLANAAPAERDHPGFLAGKLAALGITDTQKEQVRAILREYQPSVGPLVKQFVEARRALRDQIHASPVDEQAIREQSAKVAALEAD